MMMSRLTRGGKVEPISRNQILRRERGQGNNNFPCSADHYSIYPIEQDWQPYPVDPYSVISVCDDHINKFHFGKKKEQRKKKWGFDYKKLSTKRSRD